MMMIVIQYTECIQMQRRREGQRNTKNLTAQSEKLQDILGRQLETPTHGTAKSMLHVQLTSQSSLWITQSMQCCGVITSPTKADILIRIRSSVTPRNWHCDSLGRRCRSPASEQCVNDVPPCDHLNQTRCTASRSTGWHFAFGATL